MLVLVGVVIVAIIVYYFLFGGFPFFVVSGRSMYPTLKDGEIVLVRRAGKKPVIGNIYVYRRGGVRVIKRLKDFSTMSNGEIMCWFEGDNSEESYDSRHYGRVSWGRVNQCYAKTVFKVENAQ